MSLEKHQEEVERFIEQNQLEAAPGFRILDLVSEIGEIVKEATKTSDYGLSPEQISVEEDEIGDALFSLLAVSSELGINAEKALGSALDKYESRIDEKGDPGSR